MRLHRFYIKQPLGEELVVDNRALIHQWISVFRYTNGDRVFLFSSHSQGFDYLYEITSVSKQVVTLSYISQEKNIIPTRNLTLYMALVKKDTFETIVRHATELGVTTIIPVLAARSEKKNINMERLVAISEEASEQSGRGIVPHIGDIMSFAEARTKANKYHIFTSLYGSPWTALTKETQDTEAVWVGPEGGWTDGEEEQARNAGMTFLSLGTTTLKADTAAVAALSLLSLAQ